MQPGPNMRVQRTRSSALRHRAPLTRRPLGGLGLHFVGVAITLTLLSSSPLSACSCSEPRTVAAELANVHQVFAGRVTAIEILPSTWKFNDPAPTPDPAGHHSSQARVIRTTFAVSDVWKGAMSATLALRRQIHDLCGRGFVVGNAYLVYASRDPKDGVLRTSVCNRTAEIGDAQNDLERLGSPLVHFNVPLSDITPKPMTPKRR